MRLEEKLAIIGWAMYCQGYTKEKIDNMEGFEILIMRSEYEKWLEKNDKN